jgi:anti-sigma B factor antagonist
VAAIGTLVSAKAPADRSASRACHGPDRLKLIPARPRRIEAAPFTAGAMRHRQRGLSVEDGDSRPLTTQPSLGAPNWGTTGHSSPSGIRPAQRGKREWVLRLICIAGDSRDMMEPVLWALPRHVVAAATVEGLCGVMSLFSTRQESGVLIVTFESGDELNGFRNNALRDSLYELVQTQSDSLFAIDLLKVDYLSSSGVALLVGLKRRVESKGGKILLFHLQPIVRDLLAVMKLDRFFIVAEDEGQAVASLRPVPTA